MQAKVRVDEARSPHKIRLRLGRADSYCGVLSAIALGKLRVERTQNMAPGAVARIVRPHPASVANEPSRTEHQILDDCAETAAYYGLA